MAASLESAGEPVMAGGSGVSAPEGLASSRCTRERGGEARRSASKPEISTRVTSAETR